MTKTLTLHEVRMLYNQGKWDQAEEELQQTMNHIAELSEFLAAMVLRGWIAWKRGDKARAHWLWAMVYGNDFIDGLDSVSAMSGLSIYYSEIKTDLGLERTQYFVQRVQAALEGAEEASLGVSVQLNSLGIALAKIGKYEEAETILKNAMQMNETLEGRLQEAKLNRAKNGYNMVTLVLFPQDRYDDQALEELCQEVIPRYKEVAADTDLAAAYHRVSEIYLARKDTEDEALYKAYDFENMSASIWVQHLDDAPDRCVQAEKNLGKILDLIREQGEAGNKKE